MAAAQTAPLDPGSQPNPGRGPVGLVAGRGDFPIEVCEAARRAGVPGLAVIGMHGETDPAIAALADSLDWVYVGQLRRTMAALRRRGVSEVIFAGQVRPGRLFKGMRPDWTALRLLCRLKERNAESIFSAIAGEFERRGLRVLPSTTFMEDALARVGVLGRVKPGRAVRDDVAFGVRIAREIGRLNVGQTVVVKRGTVVVEAFEGTDKAIRRAGEIGHGGVTVVKVAKPGHDLRFDVPCIGMRTVESLCLAQARALVVHAGRTLLLRRERVLAACDAAGIAVIGVEIGE